MKNKQVKKKINRVKSSRAEKSFKRNLDPSLDAKFSSRGKKILVIREKKSGRVVQKISASSYDDVKNVSIRETKYKTRENRNRKVFRTAFPSRGDKAVFIRNKKGYVSRSYRTLKRYRLHGDRSASFYEIAMNSKERRIRSKADLDQMRHDTDKAASHVAGAELFGDYQREVPLVLLRERIVYVSHYDERLKP